jgi:feruloyl esterase
MNVAPDAIVATKYVNDNPALGIAFQRPICPYPKLPRYDGVGLDPKLATSFSCL